MLSSKQRAGEIVHAIIALALLVAAAPWSDLRAQNLVPNPGFESYLTCPSGDFQFDGYVANWSNPTVGGSPDYFNACNKELCSQSVPAARYGFQSARDSAMGGNAFAGIYNTNIGVNYREYVSVRLVKPLEKGAWYTVRFYASLAEASPVGIMNLGAHIGTERPAANSYVYPEPAQIRYEQFLTESGKWTEISGTYQATGGENYLVIGCFDQQLRTTPANTRGACSEVKYAGAYYYIDDVSLTPADPPSCSNSSDHYDITFKPAGISADGECCWSVSVASKRGACPLYGVNAFLPSGTTPLAWRTDQPVMPGETREIGRFCMGGIDGENIYVSYLDRALAPMSGTTRELHCGAQAAMLAVRAEPFDPGSNDYCAYDLYVDNLDTVSAPLHDLVLTIAGGEFDNGGGIDWLLSGEATADRLYWRSAGTPSVAPRGSIRIGRFSVGYANGPERLTASLYQHPLDEGGEAEVMKEIGVNCTMAGASCYNLLHAALLPGSEGTATGKGCYVVNVWREDGATCDVSRIEIVNATPDLAAEWQPYQLPAPLDLNGAGRDIGSLCFDPANPPELNVIYYNAAGAPICTQRLAMSVGERRSITSGVAGPAASRAATIEIAPNPARGAVTIAYRADGGAMRMELFDLNGKMVETIAATEAASSEGKILYDAHHLAPGIYRIRMTSAKTASLATLVVVR